MPFANRSILPAAFLLPLLGCGALTPNSNLRLTEDRTDDRVRLAAEVVLMDEVDADSVTVEDERLVVWLAEGQVSPLSVGSIVIGTEGHGYLREVVGLEQTGTRVIAQTVRTDLSRVFTDAQWDLELQQAALRSAEAEFGQEWNFGGTVLVDENFWSTASGDYVNLRVHVADGASFKMTPTIRSKAEFFSGSVVDAGFQLEGTLDYTADFVVSATGHVDENIEKVVLTKEVSFVEFIGPVPVMGTARVNVVAGIRGRIDAAISTTLHTEAHGAVHMGAGLRNTNVWTHGGCGTAPDWGVEGWNTDPNDCFGYDVRLQDSNSTLDIHAQAFVRAEIEFSLYDSAGANIQVEPWAEAWTCNPADGEAATGVDFDAGVKGQHSYHYSVLWGLLGEELGPYTWGESIRWDLYPSEPMTCGALF